MGPNHNWCAYCGRDDLTNPPESSPAPVPPVVLEALEAAQAGLIAAYGRVPMHGRVDDIDDAMAKVDAALAALRPAAEGSER